MLRDLASGSGYEAHYAFLLRAILHEARDTKQAARDGGAIDPEHRHALLSGLYAACDSSESQSLLQALFCKPQASVGEVCSQVRSTPG